MKTLYLHIGHSKTGSSYLQSVFGLNAGTLARHGVHYPADQDTKRAAQGKITSGNGKHLLLMMKRFITQGRTPDELLLGDRRSTLLSSEALIGFLTCAPGFSSVSGPMREFWQDWNAMERIRVVTEWMKAHGFERVSVLLFIRNPISHFSSAYQQQVKRLGATETIDERADKYFLPNTVLTFLKQAKAHPEITVEVRNYSVVGHDLRGVVSDWLRVPQAELTSPEIGRINRSMTAAELELQRCLNMVLGPCGDLLSDPLCEKLPHIPSDPIHPSPQAQDRLWRRLRPSMEGVNEQIKILHHYRFDRIDGWKPPDRHHFSSDQLHVIGNSIGKAIQSLRNRVAEHEAASSSTVATLQERISMLDSELAKAVATPEPARAPSEAPPYSGSLRDRLFQRFRHITRKAIERDP